jgi:predicted MFS family arabinose efflux permease
LIAGSLFLPIGAVPFVLLNAYSSPVTAGVGSLIMGLGMGMSSVCCLVLIQEIVSPMQRGSATASNLFSRNLGSTLGATAFGAVLNYGLGHTQAGAAVSPEQLRQLLDSSTGNIGAGASIGLALQQSLHLTFLTLVVISLGVVASVLFVPAIRLGRVGEAAASQAI